jgi:acyl-CoA thioester hydrolase
MANGHAFPIRVYYEDTDAGGIAYHATYLRWAERARTEALRDMGLPHADMATQLGAFLVVKRIEVEYAKPARLDDLVTVRTHIRRVTAIMDLDQDVMLGDELLAALKVRLVCVGKEGLRPRAVPEPWRSALRQRIALPENTAWTA